MRRNRDLLPVRQDQEGGLSPWTESGLFSPSTFFGASPWQVMRRMQEDMDRLFNQLVQPVAQEFQQLQQSWAPNVDISQDDREWLIEADLPGVSKDNIDVEVRDGHLLLRAELRHEQEEQPQADGGQRQGDGGGKSQGAEGAGQRQYYRRERRYGYFERVFPLPENVDEENIRCEFKDGVLKVHLPRTAEQQPQRRRIPIGESAGQGV
jgi:HSP20 family protein